MFRLEKIEEHDTFRAASDRTKILRKEFSLAESCEVKLIFAENALIAEDLLSQIREPVPDMEDD